MTIFKMSRPGAAAVALGIVGLGVGVLARTSAGFPPQQAPAAARQSAESNKANIADSGTLILAPSQSGKSLCGYSLMTGSWERVGVDNPDGASLTPTVVGSFGYVVVGKRVYAFSAGTGHWTIKEFPVAVTPRHAIGSRLRVDVGSQIHIYSAKSGDWESIDLAVD